MKNTMKKGFTLIELLVVITIIWILATGATSVYTSQIQKARDTTRINDIKALQFAIEQVYQDKQEYPKANATDFAVVQDYLDKYPEDSKHGKSSNVSGWNSNNDSQLLWYTYSVWPDENTIEYWNYELSTWFEAKWNITWKAKKDKLWGSNQDANRLEVWTASTTLWLNTALRWTSGTPANPTWGFCLIDSTNGCKDN